MKNIKFYINAQASPVVFCESLAQITDALLFWNGAIPDLVADWSMALNSILHSSAKSSQKNFMNRSK